MHFYTLLAKSGSDLFPMIVPDWQAVTFDFQAPLHPQAIGLIPAGVIAFMADGHWFKVFAMYEFLFARVLNPVHQAEG